MPEELVVPCDGFCDWTLFFERAVQMLVEGQRWFMTKLDGGAPSRTFSHHHRFRREHELPSEGGAAGGRVTAMRNSPTASTRSVTTCRIRVRAAISPSARSGFLRQHDDGIRHFFVASDEFEDVFATYVRRCAEALHRYYREDGALRDEAKARTTLLLV
ncbi:MAG: hypothetical protein ACLSVD_03195 [Eggerthellaceae bacterium]